VLILSRDVKLDSLINNRRELFKRKRRAWQKLDEAWQKLCSLRYAYNPLIEYLIQEEQRLYAITQDSFSRATSSFRSSNHKKARSYSKQGHRCRSELASIVKERRHLVAVLGIASDTHHQARNEYRFVKFEFEQARLIELKSRLEPTQKIMTSR
jgi:hypothetical protein